METKSKNPHTIVWLLAALCVLLVLRALFLLKAPLSGFGYDYGFYLYAAEHAQKLQIDSLLVALWGGFSSPLFYLGNLLHLPSGIILNEIYFFSAIFLGLAFYFVFAPKNRLAGILAAILAASSLIQSEAYFMFLWKNIVALPFLLLGFKFFLQGRWKIFALSSAAILLTHRTTAIIYFLTLLLYGIYWLIKQKKYKLLTTLLIVFSLLLTASYFLLNLKPLILNLIAHNNYFVRTGLFLENQNLFALWWPFLALGLAGLVLHLYRRENWLWPIFGGLCLLWIFFHLPFYRRIIIFLDLAVIYFAAYFLSQINFRSKLLKAALAAVLGFLIFRAANFVWAKQPWMNGADILEIKSFRPQNKGDFVLSITANDSPWLLGFAKNIRLGAPGLFEDRNTYEDWKQFWAGQNQTKFLSKYPRPLYIYQKAYRLQGPINSCLKPESKNFYRYICP